MAKVKVHLIDKESRYKIIGDFYDVLTNLKTKKEIIDFFTGLFTLSEVIMMARRIQIAKLLIAGDGYEQIRKKLKVSYQTVNKTEQWLNSRGDEYNKWITARIEKSTKTKGDTRRIARESMLDNYAHHRFFKDLLG